MKSVLFLPKSYVFLPTEFCIFLKKYIDSFDCAVMGLLFPSSVCRNCFTTLIFRDATSRYSSVWLYTSRSILATGYQCQAETLSRGLPSLATPECSAFLLSPGLVSCCFFFFIITCTKLAVLNRLTEFQKV